MTTLYEMENKLRIYYSLKENLGYVVNYINTSVESLQQATKNCLTAYSVDEVSKGYDLLSKNINTLVNRRETIKNQIIPAINFEISKLKKNIEEEQMKLT